MAFGLELQHWLFLGFQAFGIESGYMSRSEEGLVVWVLRRIIRVLQGNCLRGEC